MLDVGAKGASSMDGGDRARVCTQTSKLLQYMLTSLPRWGSRMKLPTLCVDDKDIFSSHEKTRRSLPPAGQSESM